LRSEHRKAFGIKGTRDAYHVNGVEALERILNLVLDAFAGRRASDDFKRALDEAWTPTWSKKEVQVLEGVYLQMYFPSPPEGWPHKWWKR